MNDFQLEGDLVKKRQQNIVAQVSHTAIKGIKLNSKVRAFSKVAGIYLEGRVVAITRHYLQPEIFTIKPISHIWRDFNVSSPHLINPI